MSFNDMPIDELLEQPVDLMSPQQLMEYVQRCAVLRSSSQTRRATLAKEAVVNHGVKKKPLKKDSVAQALEYLKLLTDV